MKKEECIPIIDDWYLGTDGMSFLLLKRRVITDTTKAKAHNIGKDTYTTLGYYPTLEAVAGGLHRYMSMEVLASGCASTLEEYVAKLNERISKIKQLNAAMVERVKQQMGVGNE